LQGWAAVIWLIYGAALLLSLGVITALHMQFSRDVHRREGTVVLLLLFFGMTAALIGLAYSPL